MLYRDNVCAYVEVCRRYRYEIFEIA